MHRAMFFIVLLLIFSGCREERQTSVSSKQCVDCHAVHTDSNHQIACTTCHKGNNPARDKHSAHEGYIRFPAHPDHLTQSCGPCHENIVNRISKTSHFTLSQSVNLFRAAFDAQDQLTTFRQTPQKPNPETILELADDLLRRRCFRCHLYNSGDHYPAVIHGTGCAACHLVFTDGALASHSWQKPGDAQCLSCHYGNYVGFDYYGRFEHDLPIDYRTPFTTREKYFRPYGVEYHQLQPDIHQLRGMLCIDCHSGKEMMDPASEKPSCKNCHDLNSLRRGMPAGVVRNQDHFILQSHTGKKHVIPIMQHPAHFQQEEKINCQVCHAQWTFNDFGKHFLRSDTDDFSMWANLAVQGDFEVEFIVDNNNDFDKNELPAQMTDKITGEPEDGLWYKGYTMRRWEPLLLGRDENGSITTMRPMLDYHLSWIDEDEEVRFDSVPAHAANKGLRAYTPHTTGAAGLFYQQRIEDFLIAERSGRQSSNRETDAPKDHTKQDKMQQ